MKLDKSTYDSLIINNADIDKSIDKQIPNPEDCFNDNCVVTDPYYALNLFRGLIIACFNQDYKKISRLDKGNEYEIRACFKALEYSGLLKSNESEEEHSNDNRVSITITHKVSTILTGKGLKYYNDICDYDIWNRALNAFKKNEIEPRFPYVVELCSCLNK